MTRRDTCVNGIDRETSTELKLRSTTPGIIEAPARQLEFVRRIASRCALAHEPESRVIEAVLESVTTLRAPTIGIALCFGETKRTPIVCD